MDPVLIRLPSGTLRIEALLMDLNGTLALDGRLVDGVAGRVERLRDRLDVLLASGDTFGTAADAARRLGVRHERLGPDDQAAAKLALVRRLGPGRTAVIGNGRNDAAALAAAALGICVIGPEGAAGAALGAADVVAPSAGAALDLLLAPLRLVATLRP